MAGVSKGKAGTQGRSHSQSSSQRGFGSWLLVGKHFFLTWKRTAVLSWLPAREHSCETQEAGSFWDVKTGFAVAKTSVTQCPQGWFLCGQRRLSGPSFVRTLKEAASLSPCITITTTAYRFLASESRELGFASEVGMHYREESLACLISIHPDLKVICL